MGGAGGDRQPRPALSGAAALKNAPAAMYALPSSDFYDVTSGHNNQYAAAAGYDEATGLGAPNANLIVQHLVYGFGATTTTTATAPAVATTTTTTAAATGHPSPSPPQAPRRVSGPSRPAVVAELPGGVFSVDPRQSEVDAIKSVAAFAPETAAALFAPSAAPASVGEAATLGLAPTGVSVHRSSDVARAADTFFAEMSDPQLVVSGAVLPMVG